jgi:hypothetical protein
MTTDVQRQSVDPVEVTQMIADHFFDSIVEITSKELWRCGNSVVDPHQLIVDINFIDFVLLTERGLRAIVSQAT